jgi:hypothetical protein
MKQRRHVLVVTGIVTILLLVPALIWSGKRAISAETRDATLKLPEVSTVGAEMKPYVLTPGERAKFASAACESAIPLEYLYDREAKAIVKSEESYPGMTPAEIEKLAAWRARAMKSTANGAPTVMMPERQPLSTIEIVPRRPGIEGLTPAEKAKLEASLIKGAGND